MHRRLAVRLAALSAGIVLAGVVFLSHTRTASACGCFTPPDPSVPIVQAGERIAFQIQDGKVTAHIQIQYSGPAEEFGWLLPLPSQPTLEVGTDELFIQLIQQTQPLYRLIPEFEGNCPFDPNRNGGPLGSGDDSGGDGDDGAAPGEEDGDPLVIRDSVGPYDYAVLRADSKQPMLDWLDENGFFVPDGTDDAVDPYIRPGAFFLALKLLKGNDVGDIQPVVVEYASDLPMIPIVLTGVAADPDMPVMVWVLGEHRAIPRNFFHTELNDAELNWLGAADNYIDVITKAVDEADGHHSFVTEYAGSTSVMVDVLNYPGRFGDLNELRATTDAVNYVEYLSYNGFTTSALTPPVFAPSYTSQALAVLQKHLPVPPKLVDYIGGNPNDYYLNIRYYVESLRLEQPELFEGLDLEFDPIAMTDELEERVVTPSLAADELFRKNPYMSRLFTTLSPNEMTSDPVFSFNPDLPEVTNVHEGRLIYYCGIIANDTPATTPAKLITESGWELAFPHGTGKNPWLDAGWPRSHYIHVDREEGPSETVVDNTDRIAAIIDARSSDSGCSASRSGAGLGLCLGMLFALFLAGRRRTR
jgi:hypothetical protein